MIALQVSCTYSYQSGVRGDNGSRRIFALTLPKARKADLDDAAVVKSNEWYSRARGENSRFVGFGWRLRGETYDARVDSATLHSYEDPVHCQYECGGVGDHSTIHLPVMPCSGAFPHQNFQVLSLNLLYSP